jgi:PAS domain-containing protein
MKIRRKITKPFQVFLKNLPDLKGNITYANLEAFNASGYTPEDLDKGVNLMDIIAPKSCLSPKDILNFCCAPNTFCAQY